MKVSSLIEQEIANYSMPPQLEIKVYTRRARTPKFLNEIKANLENVLSPLNIVKVFKSSKLEHCIRIRIVLVPEIVSVNEINTAAVNALVDMNLPMCESEVLIFEDLKFDIDAGGVDVNLLNMKDIVTKSLVKHLTASMIIIQGYFPKGISLLWLLNIKELRQTRGTIMTDQALKIINKYLRSDRDEVACRNELIKAGIKEFV